MTECGTGENTGIRFKSLLNFRCPPTFLSKFTCVATNHTSRVMVNIIKFCFSEAGNLSVTRWSHLLIAFASIITPYARKT